MRTPEQIQEIILDISKDRDLKYKEVLQMYMYEVLLQRLSVSKYKKNFVLRGGVLIASIVGIAKRTSSNINFIVKKIATEEYSMRKIIGEIISSTVEDGINFEFIKMNTMSTADGCENYEVYLSATYGMINTELKIDIAERDIVIFEFVEHSYQRVFEEEPIIIMAYSLESIISEKYVKCITSDSENISVKDLYDLFVVIQSEKNKIIFRSLWESINNLCEIEKFLWEIENHEVLGFLSKRDEILEATWNEYRKEYSYAINIQYVDVIENLITVGQWVKIGQDVYIDVSRLRKKLFQTGTYIGTKDLGMSLVFMGEQKWNVFEKKIEDLPKEKINVKRFFLFICFSFTLGEYSRIPVIQSLAEYADISTRKYVYIWKLKGADEIFLSSSKARIISTLESSIFCRDLDYRNLRVWKVKVQKYWE